MSFLDPYPIGRWYDPLGQHRKPYAHEYVTKVTKVTTRKTTTVPSVDEQTVRKIVREELAEILPIDVPDAPPEDL